MTEAEKLILENQMLMMAGLRCMGVRSAQLGWNIEAAEGKTKTALEEAEIIESVVPSGIAP